MQSQISFASTHSGGGLADIGFKNSGMVPVVAVEYSAEIAELYRANLGHHVIVSRVEDFNPLSVSTRPQVFHASPICTNVSNANPTAGETENDLSQAVAVAGIIRAWRPEVFTLENVRQYVPTDSFKLILATLKELGYHCQHRILNSADFGVPQTRHRLFLVATRPDMPFFEWPAPSHHDGPDMSRLTLFGVEELSRWISWHEAVADLLAKLPDSEFAPWQLGFLPAYANHGRLLVAGTQNSNCTTLTTRAGTEPAFTMTATLSRHRPKAIIEGGVVKHLTPPVLARFQTMPDGYTFRGKTILDCTIIGNGVPCKLAESIGRAIMQSVFGVSEPVEEKVAS